jgi:hypothetical protein
VEVVVEVPWMWSVTTRTTREITSFIIHVYMYTCSEPFRVESEVLLVQK